jgi:RND family efflux transporter MFP subunit
VNRKISTIAAIPLVAALSGSLSGCSNAQRAESAAPETVNDVSVIVAHETSVPDWLEAIGTVRAAQTSQVASQMMGTILEIRAREGDRVRNGQVLAILDDAQPRSGVEQATAAVAAAEKAVTAADSDLSISQSTLKRYQQLYEKKSVSPQEFDEINARRQSAEARRDLARAQQAQANAALNQARTTLGYTQIRAPFDGMVTEKKAEVGTLAAPGMPLFTVEEIRGYRLEVAVDEHDVRLVRIGQIASVSLDALGDAEIAGKVAQILPAADPASRTFLVKVDLAPSARLRSGLFGTARFSRGERKALLIPRAAIAERGQLQGIYAIDAKQVAGLRYVTLGKTSGNQVEVLSGLQSGEKLVADPGSRELGGKRIGLPQ